MASGYFSEIQRFRQTWLWFLILGLLGLFVWGFIQQIIMDIPWGNNPASDTGLMLFSLIPAGITLLFLVARLETRLDRNGISYRFFPFHRTRKTIYWNELAGTTVKKYRPLADYGGWGIRTGRGGEKAFNVSGRYGVSLELKDGKRILIGTRRPEELSRALRELAVMPPPPTP
ncbi:MAG: hypothetical protein FJY11_05240 [Bacteroidetes bacterium]|nr:hypothetical protein [Bacteroidota bacterium]